MEIQADYQSNLSFLSHPRISIFSSLASRNTEKNALQVDRGQSTFDAEGSESGRFFSRRPSVAEGNSSGVAIGRGYDMSLRSREQVRRELTKAGVPPRDIRFFEDAAGLKGDSARLYLARFQGRLPTITKETQKALFEKICYPFYERDVQRIVGKPDVIKKYGQTNWQMLDPKIKEVLIDLRYRGDYTPKTRVILQTAVAQNDRARFLQLMSEETYWVRERGVPEDRYRRRLDMLR